MEEKSIKGFSNVNICFKDEIRKGSVSISNEHISSFDDGEGYLRLRDDLFLCPGLIDEHIHGCLGFDVMDAKLESIQGMANALVREGVTSFLATTMTESEPRINAALANVASFMENQKEGATVLGIHLEGPFISKKYKGAQDENNILKPNVDKFISFQEKAKGNIKLVTFAIEEDDGSFLDYLVKHNVVASIGHSASNASTLLNGVDHGARCITHLYNAQSPFTHHESGVSGVALADSRLYTELIADFFHSTKESVKIALDCKGKEKLVLISDSTEAKYLPAGNYYLGSTPIVSDTNVAKLLNGTIAGSVLRLDKALRNISSISNISFVDAIRLASFNPASNLRLTDRGEIKEGYYADFVIMDKDFNVYATIVKGKLVYTSNEFNPFLK